MRKAAEEINAIISAIHDIGYSVGLETVFRDWCHMAALSLSNGCDMIHGNLWKQREAQYMEIVKRYKDARIFAEMLGHLTCAFEDEPFQDHLGKIYMETFTGNKKLGQCFTPMSLCEVCAENILPHSLDGMNLPVTIADEACGGGAMLIAACKVLSDRKIDWQRHVQFHCADIDSLCVHMCYVQLSLLGARAIVRRQNTITMERFDTFITPMEMLWPMMIGNITDSPITDFPITDSPTSAEEQEEQTVTKEATNSKEAIQLSLFL